MSMSYSLYNKEKKREGGTRKIGDFPKSQICRHPDHGVPGFRVFQPGIYEHTCPACGNVIRFTIPEGPSL